MGWQDTWNNFMQSNEAMGGPTSILDYGANQLANKFNNTSGSSQNNSGLPWWMRADRSRYPSPMMPPMLDPSGQMGASNYQASQSIPFQPDQGNVAYAPEEKKGMFPGIIGALLNKIPRQDPRQVALTDFYGGKGNLRDGQTIQGGLMAGYNPVSGGLLNTLTGGKFGKSTNYGLQRAYDKRIGTIEKTLGNKYGLTESQIQDVYAGTLKDEDQYDTQLIQRLRDLKANKDAEAAMLNKVTEGQGGTTITTDTSTTSTQGDGGGYNPNVHGPTNYGVGSGGQQSYDTGQGFGAHATSGGPVSNRTGRGRKDWSLGGRIGYQGGELVDEDINIEGPGFEFNENMEMAEKSPFEMRIDELMDTGMSWQEAYDIASDEFNQLAEGPEDSFSQEGIASIV